MFVILDYFFMEPTLELNCLYNYRRFYLKLRNREKLIWLKNKNAGLLLSFK